MTSQTEATRKALQALEKADIPHMIVGSVAASLHGFARTTHDVDIVVALTPESVPKLADALGEEFYFDVLSARKAAERRDMVNAIHMDSGVKVDFFILRDDEYSQVQFARRECTTLEGIPACVASPEDTILSKLLWCRIIRSERQLEDVKGILAVREGRLDWDYLNQWAKRLGVEDLLRDIAT